MLRCSKDISKTSTFITEVNINIITRLNTNTSKTYIRVLIFYIPKRYERESCNVKNIQYNIGNNSSEFLQCIPTKIVGIYSMEDIDHFPLKFYTTLISITVA